MTALVWLRNDLRLSDNTALHEALKHHDDIILLYILDEHYGRPIGEASRWWLHHSLVALNNSLRKYNAKLTLKRGNSIEIIRELVQHHAIDAIFRNACFEPEVFEKDSQILRQLQQQGITCRRLNSSLLINPSAIKNKSGGTFKVFTPFYKHVVQKLEPKPLLPTPEKIPQRSKPESESLDHWQLLPTKPDWSNGFNDWLPGENSAQQRLNKFIETNLYQYTRDRDRPDLSITSCLSPYLHFGEISPWQVYHAIKQCSALNSALDNEAEAYLRQLFWREFSAYLLFNFPSFPEENFQTKFDNFQWQSNTSALKAWQQGKTGYPIVDAGMRELWHTGFMHNRVRMIAASFLTKHLLIDWREGEAWFWNTLLDADLANNVFGWQWVAGCGADAAPYFRIFNPTLQSKKFDPNGDYLRHWLPELSKLPTRYLHEPHTAPVNLLKQVGITLGENYPVPLVNHQHARELALLTFRAL